MKNNKFWFLVIILIIGLGVYIYGQSKAGQNSFTPEVMTETASSNDDTIMADSGRYKNYQQNEYESASGKKRVIFFHAVWCPTCKVANEEFTSQKDRIPEDVILFKTDYDTETELKKKYGITYQHTFVLVDENGDEIKKWNGGGIEELISNT
jgi:thiol-disulfide isomerase/thioredoxin